MSDFNVKGLVHSIKVLFRTIKVLNGYASTACAAQAECTSNNNYD